MSRKAIGMYNCTQLNHNLYGQVGTIFGGYGNVGLGITNRMAQSGMVTIVPYRSRTWQNDPRQAALAGVDFWSTYLRMVDFTRPAMIRAVMEPSDYVVYCIGRETCPSILRFRDLDWGYDVVHRQLPVDIAKMCKEMGKEGFVYISMIGADPNSDSAILRAKGRAEMEIREILPEAIIIRPSDVMTLQGQAYTDIFKKFGYQLKWAPAFVFPEMLERRTAPVFCNDIGTAVVFALRDRNMHGKTFELGGRQVFTMKQVIEAVARTCQIPFETYHVPYPVARMAGSFFEKVKWTSMFPKEFIIRMQYDSVPNALKDPNILGWEDLGIDERDLKLAEEILPISLFNTMNVGYHRMMNTSQLTEGRFTF
eukprot:Sspe_Gene.13218::Locus_4537_Transcript_1_1_Confidence_1.000_Length_1281::g.13218::m.13218/K03953/NDUFA9; NADH dehydrogenase (ubiquinone) 1 alpha subcomplex subunit 9